MLHQVTADSRWPERRSICLCAALVVVVGELATQAQEAAPVAELPRAIVPAAPWSEQAARDAQQDHSAVVYDGVTPNKLVCDTTLRQLPDGSWILFMLAGGDTEPLPENHIAVMRSGDEGRTWTPLQPLDVGHPRQGNTIGQCPSEVLVHGGAARCSLPPTPGTGTRIGNPGW